MAAEDEILQYTDVQHIKTKEMYAGQLQPILYNNMHLMDAEGKFYMTNTNQVPALLKCFDEIIVNAVDHARDPKNKVTFIGVKFNAGRITVVNNGKGISLKKQNVIIDGKTEKMYIPEIVFGVTKTGSNLKKETDNTKAGTNGIGAKIANIHATKFTVKTITNKTQFTKTWYNSMSECSDPELTKVDSEDYTSINFIPDYENFKYEVVEYKDRLIPTKEDHDIITDWLRLRMYYVAAYVGEKVSVKFNDIVVEANTPELFGRHLLNVYSEEIVKDVYTLSGQFKSSHPDCKSYPINLSIFMLPSGEKINKKLLPQSISVINGTVSSSGNHINLLTEKVIAKVIAKIKTAKKSSTKGDTKEIKCTNNEAMGGIHFVMSAAIPGVTWDSQTKNKVNIPTEYYNSYDLTKKFTGECINGIYDRFFKQEVKATKKVDHDKYNPARFAGTKKKQHCMLLIAEGDSAVTFLKGGLKENQKDKTIGAPNNDYCGILSIQGVLSNVEKVLKTKTNAEGNDVITNVSKVIDNERFAKVVDAFGLDYRKKYETDEEVATLNYGKLLLCVDQDVDGVGKIASLVIVWLNRFWPALLHKGVIGRFVTPLVRVYKKKNMKKPIAEFRYEAELQDWLKDNELDMSNHVIKYYKGLASNDNHEVVDLFVPEKFHSNVQMYSMDKNASDHITSYFQQDSTYRKMALSSPVKYLTSEKSLRYYEEHRIPMKKQQLDIDTKAYKHDALERQLPHIIDGLNPARRKIITGAISRFKSMSDEQKVYQLCGYVASELHYHHGDTSLNKTITCMAQGFVGAHNFPLLKSIGQFGSRHGDEAGSPRYICVGLSKIVNVILPPEDKFILPYVFEDNERAEPQYYVPVVPLCVLESYNIVSEAWNHKGYGRDINRVIKAIYRYLDGDKKLITAAETLYNMTTVDEEVETPDLKLKVNNSRYKGTIRNINGIEYSIGSYEVKGSNSITITDLPIGKKTQTFIKSIKDKMKKNKNYVVAKIVDNSSNEEVLIDVTFTVPISELKPIKSKFDIIIATLNIKESLRPFLNYFSHHRSILEFGNNYDAALLIWMHARLNLYSKRVGRRIILLNLKILEEQESIRFIKIAEELKFTKKKDEAEAIAILEKNKFIKLDKTLLHSPQYLPNEELHELITNGKNASYNYLLNLRAVDLVISEVEKRTKKIKSFEQDLEVNKSYLTESPPCKSLWLQEINKFLEITDIEINEEDESEDEKEYDDSSVLDGDDEDDEDDE